MLRRRDPPRWTVVVPNHQELDRGTLHSILKQARLGRQEFLASL